MPMIYAPPHNTFLRRHYRRDSVAELTRRFNAQFGTRKSPNAIQQQLPRLGLTRRPITRWTARRLTRFRNAYGRIPAARLARQLGVSTKALHHKASELDLHIRPCRRWTDRFFLAFGDGSRARCAA